MAWAWFKGLHDAEVLFCRFTQVGLLRLLSTKAVMGEDCLTMRAAWAVFDRWLNDPRISFLDEPAGTDTAFRNVTATMSNKASPKLLGDAYLLALSHAGGSVLVSLDGGLTELGRKSNCDVVLL